MIIISNPIPVENEIQIIHSLFEEGLLLFHIRKPDFSEDEMKAFLSEIGLEFSNRLVLHSQHQLAETFGINRIHFTEKMRNETSEEKLKNWKEKAFRLSTSVHSMRDFNTLESEFEYAFLSPIYPSISKPDYVSEINHCEEIEKRTTSTKLIALGGITYENIQKTMEFGFDDVALLGTIWNSSNPIENFKLCQQVAHSHSL